jgi:hypothetical protein
MNKILSLLFFIVLINSQSPTEDIILNPKITSFIDPAQEMCLANNRLYFESFLSLNFDNYAKTFFNDPSTRFNHKNTQFIVDDKNNLVNITSSSVDGLDYNQIINLFVPGLKLIQSVTPFNVRTRFSVRQQNHITLNQTYISETRYLMGEIQNFTGILQAAIYDSYDYHQYQITPNGAFIKELSNTEYAYILNEAQTKLALSLPAGPQRDAFFHRVWSTNPKWNLNNDVNLGMSLY